MESGLIVVPFSLNAKLTDGRTQVAATMRPVGPTCPRDCPSLNNGCYAQKGHSSIWAQRSAERSDSLNKAAGSRLLRHHVSGDFMKPDGTLDVDYLLDVFVFHVLHPEVQGWVYTHAITEIIAAGFTPLDVPRNLALIASCDSPEDYVVAKAYGWRTARVSADGKATAFGEVSCLNDTRGMTCAECKICLPGRKADIVFKMKGKRKEQREKENL